MYFRGSGFAFPILGADFLEYFNLMGDVIKQKLVDTVTSLKT